MFGGFVASLGIGLRIDGSGDPTPWDDLVLMLGALQDTAPPVPATEGSRGQQRARGLAGPGGARAGATATAATTGTGIPPCLWYSHGALELYSAELGTYWASNSTSQSH